LYCLKKAFHCLSKGKIPKIRETAGITSSPVEKFDIIERNAGKELLSVTVLAVLRSCLLAIGYCVKICIY
jgi:hypothetical protein